MSSSVRVSCEIASMEMLIEGIISLGLAVRDLRQANEKIRELENCAGQKVKVDCVIENEVGDKIGIKKNAEGKVEFVVQNENSSSVKATIDRVTQSYARLKILDEVKRRGYQTVKEEKLANGSIRLVVERWR